MITVTFFSNFLVHHQTPFCEAMIRLIGDGFRFVATVPVPRERLELGYQNLENTPYAINAYKDEASYQEALRLSDQSDVVILGSAPDKFIEKRLLENKLTFHYSERFFKKFRWRFDPRVWRMRYQRDIRFRKKNYYMLCASAYTAPDCRFIFAYPKKTFRWGYFPKVRQYQDISDIIAKKTPASILWAGRLINWKHPEKAVKTAERLKKDGVRFKLSIIGTGEMEEKLKVMIRSKGLEDCVTLLGAMPHEKVREYMEQSEIFLFTSDRQEGWGAVLNEAMNSACAAVASKEIGSVPFLLQHGENGLIYQNNSDRLLYRYVKELLEQRDLRIKLQQNAYTSITEIWNADVAAERLLYLIDCIREGVETGFQYGPCSRD